MGEIDEPVREQLARTAEVDEAVRCLLRYVAGEKDALTALSSLWTARRVVDRLTAICVQRARQQEASWSEIGDSLGTTRQAVWEKYKDNPRR